MMQTRNYFTLPPIVNGYPLDDRISVVVPVARTNLCQNPSFETNTTSWTAIGGSIARSTSFQYHGAYSLAVTPTAATTDGARYDTVSLVSGTAYAYSCKVLGINGKSYKIAIETTAGVELAAITFVASGRWQWVYGYYTESSTTTRRLTLRKAGGTELSIFYIDGAQVEAIAAGETVSTYIDGAQQGLVPNQNPVAYYWNGTPHASSSVRSALTRAGGMVVPFRYFGFFLTALIGLGLAPPQNVATEYARIDGGYDDYTRKPTRQFTITGNFESRAEYLSLRQQRGGLSRLLDRDLVAQDQRLVLMRDVVDECGAISASTCRLLGKYQGGLEGSTDNHVASVAPITFTQYLGVVLSDGESGAALNVQTSVTNTNYAAERTAAGAWRNISSTFNNQIFAMVYAPDGSLVIAGAFTVPQTRVGSWDGTTFSAMGAGLPAGITSLAVGPDGSIYAGGTSMTIGGITGTVARFSGGAWAIVGATGTMVRNVTDMVWARNGILYAVGNDGLGFATLNQWNGTAWSSLFLSGSASGFEAVAEGFNGLYIGGNFANLNGDANQDHIALYSITAATWSALSTGMGSLLAGHCLRVGADGRLYLIGGFTTAGGVTVNHAAVWNGVSFAGLSAGLTANGALGEIRQLPNDNMLFGGNFTTVNGVTFPDSLAIWNGSVFVPLDADLPTGAGNPISALATSLDGKMAIGYNTTGTSTTAALTTITNPGTARSYPTVVINGPSSGTARIWSLLNVTTNRNIYLNYTINAGETATFVFQPDNLSFTSTFAGDLNSTIMPGSNLSDFFLQPGANSISFFSASSTVTAVIYFRPAYLSIDDVP